MSEVRVNKKKVCCHGDQDDEGSGHPLIYLDMGEEEKIDCPYCDKAFIYDCTVAAVQEKVTTKDDEFS